jgi:hypothetical protein
MPKESFVKIEDFGKFAQKEFDNIETIDLLLGFLRILKKENKDETEQNK